MMSIHSLAKMMFGVMVLSLLYFNASIGSAQGLLGDPSNVSGDLGGGSIHIGGGAVTKETLLFEKTTLNLMTTTETFVINLPEDTADIKAEEVFLAGEIGLGRMVDFWGKVGQSKIKGDGFESSNSPSYSGGLRVSPPQEGLIRVGFLIQGSYVKAKDKDIEVLVSGNKPVGVGAAFFNGIGTGNDTLEIMRYDALLGFGMQGFKGIRPYAGLLYTRIDGNEKGSVQGQGTLSTCTPLCVDTTEAFSISWNQDFQSNQAIGGVAGFVLNPSEKTGITLEGHFGSQTAYMVALFMKF